MQLLLFLWCALAVLALVLTVWAVSVRIRDASIIDIFWGFGFVVIAWVAFLFTPGSGNDRQRLILSVTTLWGLRLTVHLGRRNIRKGEDFRYRAMRKKHGPRFPIISLRTVYLLQGALMIVVGLPVIVGSMNSAVERRWLLAVGGVVWLLGVVFETVGDLQLTAFKRDPANAGKVLRTGLWAWTRHPNYFGDALAWWGIWLIACTHEWGPLTILGPVAMTVLLRRVSGVPMLERTMAKRRPDYAAYVASTSAFLPRPPKRGDSSPSTARQ